MPGHTKAERKKNKKKDVTQTDAFRFNIMRVLRAQKKKQEAKKKKKKKAKKK